MLKINKNHKGMNKKNVVGKVTKLTGGLLSLVILCSGCSSDEIIYDRAMIEIAGEVVALDIKDYSNTSSAVNKLYLEDGTLITLHPNDIKLYNSRSEKALEVEKTLTTITVENEVGYYDTEEYDRALVQSDDEVLVVTIKDYERLSESRNKLYLEDGTALRLSPDDLVLYNSKSSVMKEVEEKVLRKIKENKQLPNK